MNRRTRLATLVATLLLMVEVAAVLDAESFARIIHFK